MWVDTRVVVVLVSSAIPASVSDDGASAKWICGIEQRIHNPMDHVLVAAASTTQLITGVSVGVLGSYWVKPAVVLGQKRCGVESVVESGHVIADGIAEELGPCKLPLVRR